MKKKLLFAIVLLILFTSYKPQSFFLGTEFNIKEINIENNSILKNNEIKKNLNFLYNKNLIFLDSLEIKEVLKNMDFIESFEIKKKYPNKINVKIFEKKPIAILQYKKEKFYISKNMDLINYINLEEYKNLPLIFGDKKSFRELYIKLKKIKFPVDSITRYYLYESNRWDLETREKKIIKLPIKHYTISLQNFLNLSKNNNFDKYKIFDYRISNQLILK